MFNDNQLQMLNSELDSSRIKTREKGTISLSYIEGHSAIETANNVFGFGNWDYAISKLEQVSSEINQNQNNVICYKAVVQVLVHSVDHSQDVSREDVGFGTGVSKSLADAHEGAAKEAVTDALKRALRSFGNQFGNSLYSKDKNNNHNSYNGNYKNQQNYSQQLANNYQHQQYNQAQNSQQPYQHQNDFSTLINSGLQIIDNGDFLTVGGDGIFEKKDIIKNAGFRWSSQDRVWYMQRRQAA
jgi:DNA repair and recombination protein RAD52